MRIQWVNALRAVVATAVLVSAAVHLYVYADGFSGIPVIGPLFLAQVIGGVGIAGMVVLWRHWLPALFAAGFGLTTAAAYWISVTRGLFGVREVAVGWPEIVAEAAEYAVVIFGATVAVALRRKRRATVAAALRRRRRATGLIAPAVRHPPSGRGTPA